MIWKAGNIKTKWKIFFANKPEDISKYRIAALIVSFNEAPFMVAQNAVTAGYSVWGLKNVFVLDDSTDPKIVDGLKEISGNVGFNLVRRSGRRGYKAGAINDWLKEWKDKYDYIFVLDADQRPIPGALDRVMGFFSDKNIAYVQFPQYYSNPKTYIALAAWLQQVPFLRLIMKGRDTRGTPFILGSGVILSVKPLLEVGGFYEETVTEDIYTSVLLQGKGYYGRYVDFPAVWKGEAPDSYQGYWIQQSRWSFGGFQIFRRLFFLKLKFKQFWDFFIGGLYWFKISLFVLFEVAAPFVFLVFGISLFKAQAAVFFVLYLLIFASSLLYYLISLRKYGYRFREFMLHNGVQFMDSFPVLSSFFMALSGMRRPFNVTPKGKDRKDPISIVLPTYTFLGLLLIALASGIFRMAHSSSIAYISAIGINLFWVSWMIMGFSAGIFILVQTKMPSKIVNGARQIYDKELVSLYEVIHNAVILERIIADYYSKLSQEINDGKMKNTMLDEANESMRHASIYEECLANAGLSVGSNNSTATEHFAFVIEEKVRAMRKNCIEAQSEHKRNLADCIGLDEELIMRSMAEFSVEVLEPVIKGELLSKLSSIIDDEEDHYWENIEIIKDLRNQADLAT